MYKNNQVNNDELNIIQLIQIFWKGRFKVILILIISIIFLLIHQSIIKNNSSSFLASTEIRPISVSGANEYIVLKDLDSSYIEFVGKIKSVSHLDEENITNNL
jgi:LPS O-antigen subunit length determinant protein (WzzB/FepE family)